MIGQQRHATKSRRQARYLSVHDELVSGVHLRLEFPELRNDSGIETSVAPDERYLLLLDDLLLLGDFDVAGLADVLELVLSLFGDYDALQQASL